MRTLIFSFCIFTALIKYAISCDTIPASKFLGTWHVSEILAVPEGEPDPEATETSYPEVLRISRDGDTLQIKYHDQFGRRGTFDYLVTNQGCDIILSFRDLTTKHGDSYATIHHIKSVGDTLHGIAFGRVRLFEWRAVKSDESQKINRIPKKQQ